MKNSTLKLWPIALVGSLILSVLVQAAPSAPATAISPPLAPRVSLGDPVTLAGWSGIETGPGGAQLATGRTASFRHPDGPRGLVKHGFRLLHDNAYDWHDYFGLVLDLRPADARALTLQVTLVTAQGEIVTSTTAVAGTGWRTVTLPWSAFAYERGRTNFLQSIREVRVRVDLAEGSSPATVGLRDVCVVRGDRVALAAAVRGRSGQPGETVTYPVEVANATGETQTVTLSVDRPGWQGMTTAVEPATLTLAPGETRAAELRVTLGERVAPGGHEQQVLRAIANADAARAATLTFTTAHALPHPYILHTPARWEEVRRKVRDHAWAREQQDEFVARSARWNVPEIAAPPGNDPDDTMGPFLFRTTEEHNLMAAGVAWQLTREPAHAGKIRQFLLRLSDPVRGYAKTFRACNQSLVQEGHFFQHLVMAYDMALDSGVFSAADRAQIDAALRLLLETMDRANRGGSINNWNLSELCGAFYTALVLQDLERAGRFFAAPGGIKDHLAKGTLDDGWWYECSISYNVWCASEFTQVALAYESWGYNFRDERVPASYSRDVLLGRADGAPELGDGGLRGLPLEEARTPFGMNKDIWGPSTRPWREIRHLWNGLLPFLDWRGVMFGVNDSTENNVLAPRPEVGGQPFELAYYVYRDPAYAALVKRAPKRDLLYGVPELPTQTPEQYRASAYADNVGLAMLRSQTPGRAQREQIQAVLHYGIHGWAHGHFDRTGLLSLMRYGRSFFNPEMVWFSYEPFMYKFYVQTSVAKNMVVVDRKMQEATPSARLLFHPGQVMQAAVVETDTRWSNPPYGGMVYDYVPVKTFAEKTWREGRSVPAPAQLPVYGARTGFTEKVRQRRLMIVTDDYVVLADHLRGGAPHNYECLFQMKGFEGIESAAKKFLRHDAQWETDPVASAQFVTDASWYEAAAPAKARFTMRFGPGADNAGTRALYSEDGILTLDVHSLWPAQQEIMVATAPEEHGTQKRLFYTVRGDGRVLADGKFGAWILGQADLDVPLAGVKTLELETRTELDAKPTLFWAAARVVTRDGRELPLSALPATTDNVRTAAPGKDYFGGPIKIVGQPYAFATPAQSQDVKRAAIVRVDLTGIDAVKFKAVLGGDYPLGDETQRRKTYAIRAPGGNAAEARFLTLIEPHEGKPLVRAATATGPDSLRVELTDGRVQEIAIQNLTGSGTDITVTLVEQRDGRTIRTEATAAGK